MATSLSEFLINVDLFAKLQKTVQGRTVALDRVGQGYSRGSLFSSGTTANKADRLYFEVDQAITSGNSVTLDLFDLANFDATTDVLGNTVSFAEIVALLIENESGSAGNLIVGGDGTTAAWNSPFGGDDDAAVTLDPGGVLFLFNPTDPAYAVADTSNHLLKLAASGGDTIHNITILGRSA